MTEYNWLFTNEEREEGYSGEEDEEEEDLEEIQSILYSTIHYEHMQDDILTTTTEAAYDLDLQEKIVADDGLQDNGRKPSFTLTLPQTNVEDNAIQSDLKKNLSISSITDSENLKAEVPTLTPQKPTAKKRKSDIDVINLVSESDSSAAGGWGEKYIVIDSISDDSDVEITAQMDKRRKLQNKEKNRAEKVIKIDGDASSLSSSTSDESFCDETSSIEGIKIHVHSAGRSVVLDCDDLDINKCDIKLDTTLEEIHASLGEGNWSLTNNKPAYSLQRSRTQSRYYTPFDVRCCNCNQVGHLSKLCPKPKKRLCCLCGKCGHLFMTCPQRLCHNCSKPGHAAQKCPIRKRSRYFVCLRCGMAGHKRVECSEMWRQFHLTTSEGKLVKGTGKENKRVYCYNCGEKGHWGFECEDERMAKFVLVSCPLLSSYDHPSRIMPTSTNHYKEVKPDRSSDTPRNLKEKLKNCMSKAKKVSKKATNKFSEKISNKVAHSEDRNASKMENKFAESFPRGKTIESSRGQSSNRDRMPPGSNPSKYHLLKDGNSEASEQEAGHSAESTAENAFEIQPCPKGYTRKILKKLLYQEGMGAISKTGKKRLRQYSQYAKKRGIYEKIARTAIAFVSAKGKGKQTEDRMVSSRGNGISQKETKDSHEGSYIDLAYEEEPRGQTKLKKFKEAVKDRFVSAPDVIANLQVQIKQTVGKNRLKRLKRAAERNSTPKQFKPSHTQTSPNSGKKKNDRGFRFDQ